MWNEGKFENRAIEQVGNSVKIEIEENFPAQPNWNLQREGTRKGKAKRKEMNGGTHCMLLSFDVGQALSTPGARW